MRIDGSGVDARACFRQEQGTCDNVFEGGGGEAEGAVRREQDERLDVDCVVGRIERDGRGLLLVCRGRDAR